jgi:hypothetical protein
MTEFFEIQLAGLRPLVRLTFVDCTGSLVANVARMSQRSPPVSVCLAGCPSRPAQKTNPEGWQVARIRRCAMELPHSDIVLQRRCRAAILGKFK